MVEKAILEFSIQWVAGLQPQLSLETSIDGQIWVNSMVAAEDVPTRVLVVCHHAEDAPGVQDVLPRHPPKVPHQSLGSSYHIPQLDGNSNLSFQDQEQDKVQEIVWSCKCCRYEIFFDTSTIISLRDCSPFRV